MLSQATAIAPSMASVNNGPAGSIKAIDTLTVHRISSGQVVVDLQTAVKELVENSLDAGATNIEVRFKDHGAESIEVVDNGSGIAASDYDFVGLKHHTSKLESFEDLESVSTFGFRGEALSSLCALCSSVSIITATEKDAPMGTVLELDRLGKVSNRSGKVARQRGTTVMISDLFKPLPVRRKEFERNAKREFGKALNVLNAYALLPCAKENGGVRLTCTHQPKGGKKSVQLRTDGSPSVRASVSAMWGPKTLENLVELDLAFDVQTEKSVLRRQGLPPSESRTNRISVRGLISKFSLNCGRNGTDRQFYYINGRPCNPTKVQKAFNEVYKTFNATQSPMIIADFIFPGGCVDVNVSPDKRTVLIHSEDSLVQALKTALEERFASERSTYNVVGAQTQGPKTIGPPAPVPSSVRQQDATPGRQRTPLFDPESSEEEQDSSDKELAINAQPGFGSPVLLMPEHLAEDVEPDDSDAPVIGTTTADHGRGKAHIVPDAANGANVDQTDDNDNMVSVTAPRRQPRHESRVTTPLSPTVTQIVSLPNVLPPFGHSSSSPKQSTSKLPTTPSRSLPPPAIQIIPAPRASTAHSAKTGTGQLILSTSGASWNLKSSSSIPSDSSADTRPRKRQRLLEDTSSNAADIVVCNQTFAKGFRMRMAGYAMAGSQAAEQPGSSGESEAEELRVADASGEDLLDDAPTKLNLLEDSSIPSSKGCSSVTVTPASGTPDLNAVAGTSVSAETGNTRRPAADRRHHQAPSFRETDSEIIDDADAESSPEPNDNGAQEYVRTTPLVTSKVRFDEEAVVKQWGTSRIAVFASTANDVLVQSVGKTQTDCDNATAVKALSRVISKPDFVAMEVIGQFNLGFIIARRQHTAIPTSSTSSQEKADSDTPKDDLFIIDQHAADEKYNFEQLQQTTKIESQALFRPKPLELTAADELLAIDNIEILRRNGFEIEVDDSPPAGGHRLKLVAQPVSKATVFDIRDLEELLHLLRDSPRGQVVRCSKARSMFAMRACRKSIMVGTPLQPKQMTSVIRHMGTMDQPWNCPHGRPTMRHLADIVNGGRRHLEQKDIKWSEFQ